jgi:hypothetical protein
MFHNVSRAFLDFETFETFNTNIFPMISETVLNDMNKIYEPEWYKSFVNNITFVNDRLKNW